MLLADASRPSDRAILLLLEMERNGTGNGTMSEMDQEMEP